MGSSLILEKGVVGVIEDWGPILSCYTSSRWRAIRELVGVIRGTERLDRILEVSDTLRGGVCDLVTVIRGSLESRERVLDVIGRLKFESGVRLGVGGGKYRCSLGRTVEVPSVVSIVVVLGL
jgi:hypothetical protein